MSELNQQQPVQQEPVLEHNSGVQPAVDQHVPRPGSPESEEPTSGYMSDSSAYERDQAELEGQQPQQPSQDELQELSERLGINPEDIGKPDQPEEPKEERLSTEDWYSKQFGTPEAKQFAENFKKHFGMDIKQVYEVINSTAQVTQGLEQWRKEVHAQQQVKQLQQEWGNEFGDVMPQVIQKFQQIRKTNPRQAQALDNLDGARMLRALVLQEKQQGQSVQPNLSQPPTYLPNRRPLQRGGNGTPNVVKMSDYVNMSDSEAQQVNAGLMNGSIQIIRDM